MIVNVKTTHCDKRHYPLLIWFLHVLVLACAIQSLAFPVSAKPPPRHSGNKTQAILQSYHDLSRQAEKTNGQYLAAIENSHELNKKVVMARQAIRDTEQERAIIQGKLNVLHKKVSIFVDGLYKGVHISRFFVVFLSKSPQLALDQLSVVEFLGRDFNYQLSHYLHNQANLTLVENKYREQIISAQNAQVDAQKAISHAKAMGFHLKVESLKIRAMYRSLTGKELKALRGPDYPFDRKLLPKDASVASIAVNAAISRVGDPYVWGATGPNAFDCSGLMLWAYRQAGKEIPRTSQAQYVQGIPINRGELVPGDLVIIYPDASHVAMYIGEGYVIHASTFGIPVKIVPVNQAGPVLAYRRFNFA